MNKKKQIIDTYNKSAKALAIKFDKIGALTSQIKETFSYIKKKNPKVIEIGCGNGRDAEEILKYTNNYLGIDISKELIKLAQEKNPSGKFKVGDIENYILPNKFDAIFAFASLIHIPQKNLKKIFEQAFVALNKGGLFRISMKYSNEYKEIIKKDEFGTRTYYLYSQKNMEELAKNFKIIKNQTITTRGQVWIELLLKK